MPEKGITLQDFCDRLQVLCNDGYSQRNLYVATKDGLIPVNELEFVFKSDAFVNGLIPFRIK